MTEIVEKAKTGPWDVFQSMLLPLTLLIGGFFVYKWLTGQSSPIYTNGGTIAGGGGGIQPGEQGPSKVYGPAGTLSNGNPVTNALSFITAGPGTGTRASTFPLAGPGMMSTSRALDPSEAAYLGNTGQVGNQWLAKNNIPLMPSSLGSTTRYAVFTGERVDTQAGSVLAMVSGRDSPIQGQTAYYNPASGQAWGGNTNVVNYLYNTAAPSVQGNDYASAISKARTTAEVNALTAAAWRARYA